MKRGLVGVFIFLISLTAWSAPPKAEKKANHAQPKTKKNLTPVPQKAVTPTPTPTPVPTPVPKLSMSKDTPHSQLPFWRTKENSRRKVMENREVVVAVAKEDLPDDHIFFTMKGAGLVSAPKDFSFRISQDYSKLKDVSDHFKTVTFDPAQNKLFLVTEALGYQARMILLMTPVSEDWRSELQWEVVWGAFQGMKGVIGYQEMKPGKTEVSLLAEYKSKELPLPKILMGFALEVITQKVAEKMRAFIESQYAIASMTSSPANRAPASVSQ